MEENKVVLSLSNYIDLIKENERLKLQLEHKENNYNAFCSYAKEVVKNNASYHLNHLKNIKKGFTKEDLLVKKLNDYHYKNIADEFIKMNITYDLIERLTDELIEEREEETNE